MCGAACATFKVAILQCIITILVLAELKIAFKSN